MDNHPLSHFGRYEILGELGRGAMGIVYKARDPRIDRLVAIKTISVHGVGDDDEQSFRERFHLEARAAGRLSHPGIVTIFDVGEDPETRAPYIIMECVSGETLQKLLARSRKLSFRTSLKLAQQLAEALDYAHAQGVVHRDMKPANIIIGEDGHAKITDFGIAKLNLAQLTIAGQALGTPAYMAPEQLEGEQVDGRADLFSLGVILYAMLTGHRPFQGNSAATVSFKVVNREPVPATAFDADFPPEIDYLIARAIAKEPAQRYQTGREMALDLKELLRGRAPRSFGDALLPQNSPATSLQAIHEATAANLSRTGNRPREMPGAPFSLIGKAIAQFRRPRLRIGIAVLAGLAAAIGFAYFNRRIFTRHDATFAQTQASAQAPANSPAGTVAPASSAGQTSSETGQVTKPAEVSSRAATPSRKAHARPADSTLQVEVEHHFKSANVAIWVDDRLALTHELESRKKRLVVFGGKSELQTISVKLPSGQHTIGVRVESGGDYSLSQTIPGEFAKNVPRTLHVKCERQKLLLTW